MKRPVIAVVVVVVLTAVALFAMGQPAWCKCGSFAIAAWDPWSMHNSQHLIDPYTFTHVLHGFVFCALLWVVLRGRFVQWHAAIVFGLEGAWEVLENTPMVINRYREVTVSLDYYGDSVANSLADLGACGVGYALARKLPLWASIGGFVLTEVALALWIRDSLLLNVVMLLVPIDAVREWQAGG